MAEMERATSEDSLTSETRRTAAGSPSPNKVALMASILPPTSRQRGFSGRRLEPLHRGALDEVELLLEVDDRAILRLRLECDGVHQGANQLNTSTALGRRFGGRTVRQVLGIEAVPGVDDA